MVGISKRPLGDQGGIFCMFARHAVDLGTLQSFFHGQWRKNGGESFGQHGFPSTGRTDEDYIVSARCRDLQCTFDIFLPLYIRKINSALLLSLQEFMLKIQLDGVLCTSIRKNKGYHIFQVQHAITGYLLNKSRFSCIHFRKDKTLETLLC